MMRRRPLPLVHYLVEGGPLLDDASVCVGAFDGGRPCPPLRFILSRGRPPLGGCPGGCFGEL